MSEEPVNDGLWGDFVFDGMVVEDGCVIDPGAKIPIEDYRRGVRFIPTPSSASREG